MTPAVARVAAIALTALLAALIAGGIVARIRADAVQDASFEGVTAKLETTEASADISHKSGQRAGRIIGDLNHAVIEDQRAVAAARAPGATAADRERMRQRALDAFAEGQSAACGLQRADCGPAAPAPASR